MNRFLIAMLTCLLLPSWAFAGNATTFTTDTIKVVSPNVFSKRYQVLLIEPGAWIAAKGRVLADTLGAQTGTSIVLQGSFASPAGYRHTFDHLWADSLSTDSMTVAGNGVVTGNLSIQGNTTIGNATGDALTFHPSAWTLTNAVSITGTWTNLGTVTTADINGGTIDGATIGGASAGLGTFTTLKSDSLNIGSGDLIVAPTQNEVRLGSGVKFGVGTTPGAPGHIDETVANNVGLPLRLSNLDVPSGSETGQAVGIEFYLGSYAGSNEGARIVAGKDNDFFTGSSTTVIDGNLQFWTTQDATQGEAARITNDGIVIIGDGTTTGNTNMTIGLTIDHRGNDNQALAIKSSDVATGLASAAAVSTDDYFTVKKVAATTGGTSLQSLAEDAAQAVVFRLESYGGTANTAKTTSGLGLFDLTAYEHDGANGLSNITADGNVFSVRAYVGGVSLTRFLVDEDGDIYSVTAAQTFDDYEDVALLNAYEMLRSGQSFYHDQEETLLEIGLLGAPISEGGMTNMVVLNDLQTGGIRQNSDRIFRLEQENAILKKQLESLRAEIFFNSIGGQY